MIMRQTETTGIIYAIFSATCLVAASVCVAAGHVASADRLRQQWSRPGLGVELYFKEAA